MIWTPASFTQEGHCRASFWIRINCMSRTDILPWGPTSVLLPPQGSSSSIPKRSAWPCRNRVSISGFRNGASFACQAQSGEPGNPRNPKGCCWVARWMNRSIVSVQEAVPIAKQMFLAIGYLHSKSRPGSGLDLWKQWRNKEWWLNPTGDLYTIAYPQ